MKEIGIDARDDIDGLRAELQDQEVEASENAGLAYSAAPVVQFLGSTSGSPPTSIDPHALEVWETEGGAIG